MSKHKAAGKTKQHHRPSGKRLGVKVAHGEKVNISDVLVRQRGTSFKAGKGVKVGRDYTLFASKEGIVRFENRLGRKQVSIY
jgi:large subunit ribosomal protein L27